MQHCCTTLATCQCRISCCTVALVPHTDRQTDRQRGQAFVVVFISLLFIFMFSFFNLMRFPIGCCCCCCLCLCYLIISSQPPCGQLSPSLPRWGNNESEQAKPQHAAHIRRPCYYFYCYCYYTYSILTYFYYTLRCAVLQPVPHASPSPSSLLLLLPLLLPDDCQQCGLAVRLS